EGPRALGRLPLPRVGWAVRPSSGREGVHLHVVGGKSRVLVGLVAAVALVASACSGGSGGGSAAPGGILRIGLERPQSLDPAQARYPVEMLVVDQLFDGLTAYDPATLEVRPALAA